MLRCVYTILPASYRERSLVLTGKWWPLFLTLLTSNWKLEAAWKKLAFLKAQRAGRWNEEVSHDRIKRLDYTNRKGETSMTNTNHVYGLAM